RNAIKEYDGDKRCITLRIAQDDDVVRIEVCDAGMGIAAENLDRIFSHGFTTRATGHGFGLHSSANAAKELDGSLTVYSDGPGQGATFTLTLPLRSYQACPGVQ
ncbi:MAG: ATP-binding protein, partial [Planctomycetota bacterium]|nr:ATP-binding protein [Planctomycetota bacterium]